MRMWYIYKITNLITGKSYVGQRHIDDSKSASNDKYMGSGNYIKYSIKKHGLANFKKEILKDKIYCQAAASLLEEIFIKKENTLSPNGYNLRSSCLQNGIVSEKTKLKMRVSNKSFLPEVRSKISKALKGIKRSEEFKQKLSITNKGRKHTEKAKKKMQGKVSWNKGIKTSEETKEKMRGKIPWNKGIKYHTEEAKKKMSITRKGRVPWNKGIKTSEEVKMKISKTRKETEEHKRNLSLTKKEKIISEMSIINGGLVL